MTTQYKKKDKSQEERYLIVFQVDILEYVLFDLGTVNEDSKDSEHDINNSSSYDRVIDWSHAILIILLF